MNYNKSIGKNTTVFYLSLFLILTMMYSKSWLPGGGKLLLIETYISICIGLLILFFSFDFHEFLNLEIGFSTLERKILYLILLIFVFLTIRFNFDELNSLKAILNLICYAILIVIYFFIVPKYFYDYNFFFEKFIKIILIFGFIFTMLGLFMFLFYNAPPYRFISFIKHPNLSSKVLTVVIFPTLFYLYWKWNDLSGFMKIFFMVLIFLQFSAQLLTYDRAGILGTILGLMLFIALCYKSKSIFILPSFVIITLPVISNLFFAKGLISFFSRLALLIPAFEMIFRSEERMLWGYGLTNSFVEYSKNLLVFNVPEYDQTDPHNSYVMLVLMVGIVCTIFILLFVGILFIKSIIKAIFLKDNKISLFYIFLSSSLLAILVQGIFDAEVIRIDHYTIHYILIILGLMYISVKKTEVMKNLSQFKIGIQNY